MGGGGGEHTEEALDYIVFERIVDVFVDGGGVLGISGATTLFAANGKKYPWHRHKVSWHAVDVWRRRPPRKAQVPPIPHYLALGCANLLALLGRVYEGAAIFIAYAGLLRVGEALAPH